MPQGHQKAQTHTSEGLRFIFNANNSAFFELKIPKALALCLPATTTDARAAFVPLAITPNSMTDSGAQISGQPTALQTSNALQASTSSSCQPSGSTGISQQAHYTAAAASSCKQGQRGGTDVLSPQAARGAGASGRRRPNTAGRKRDREDPLTKAIERYMEAKAKKEEAGPQASPPSAPPQRAQRPRTAGAGECIPAPSLLWLGPVSWQGAPVCVRGHA